MGDIDVGFGSSTHSGLQGSGPGKEVSAKPLGSRESMNIEPL